MCHEDGEVDVGELLVLTCGQTRLIGERSREVCAECFRKDLTDKT